MRVQGNRALLTFNRFACLSKLSREETKVSHGVFVLTTAREREERSQTLRNPSFSRFVLLARRNVRV